MKKTFLKAVAAATVVAATVALSSVAVFAAQTTTVWTPDQPQDWVIFEQGSASNTWSDKTTSNTYTATFTDKIFNNGETGAIKGQKNKMSGDASDSLKIFTNGSNAQIKIYATINNSDAKKTSFAKVDGTKHSSDLIHANRAAAEPTLEAYTYTLVDAGEHTITFNNKEIEVYRLELTDEAIEYTNVAIKVVDLSTGSDVSDYSITLNGKAPTLTDGKYKLTVNRVYDIVAEGYDSTTYTVASGDTEKTIYLSPSDSPEYTVKGTDIQSAVNTSSKLDEGGYYGTDSMFYVAKDVKYTDNRLQFTKDATIQFKTKAGAIVNLIEIQASNKTTDATINIVDESGKVVYTTGAINGDKHTLTATIEKAGTYTLKVTEDSANTSANVNTITIKGQLESMAAEDKVDGKTDGNVAVIKGADGTYYAVVIVSEEEAQANSALNVSAGGAASVEIDTVYDSVVIDGTPYTAGDLGGSAGDFVSGIKLDINNSSSATVSAAAIQAIINVDKVAVA